MCLPKGNRMRCVFLLCLFLTTVQGCVWPIRWSTQTNQEPKEVPGSRNEDVPKQVTNKGVVITLFLKNNDMVRDALIGEITVGKLNSYRFLMDITSPSVILLNMGNFKGTYYQTKGGNEYWYNTYDATSSQSYSGTRKRLTTTLQGDNFEVTGVYATEQFLFKMGDRRIVIENQKILAAVQMTKQFPRYDGVFGLALMTGDERSEASPVHNMAKQFTEPVFSIHVRREISYTPASLILGGGDENFYKTGTLRSHDVISKANERYDGWYIRVQRVQITKTREPFEVSSSKQVAIPAPDVEYVLLPEEIKKKFFKRVYELFPSVSGENAVPCDDAFWRRLPELVLNIDGQEYTLTAEEYVLKYRIGGSIKCEFGIGSHPEVIHLGRVFMKKFYTRFNVKNKQVQFAESNPNP